MALSVDDLRRVRRRLVEMHFRARAGHLGGNLSAIDAMLLVHHELMGPNDRFVLSKGHSAGAYYATLWSLGRLTDDDLATFHQDGTRLAGHPPAKGIPDILFATGSLGHGLSLAAGLALAARLKGEQRRVFCFTSDGEWQEGSTLEAMIFAAHQKLSNLTVLVDHNRLQGFGGTDEVASMDPLGTRLSGFDLDIRTADGHDLGEMRRVLAEPSNRTTVAILNTRKGNGLSFFENRMESHYLPLSEAQFAQAMTELASA
jgi:transketolase